MQIGHKHAPPWPLRGLWRRSPPCSPWLEVKMPSVMGLLILHFGSIVYRPQWTRLKGWILIW